MTTPVWVILDEEIWDYDYVDDFIWIPSSFIDGEGQFVAKPVVWRLVADLETFRYVGKESQWRFISETNQWRFVAFKELYRYIADKE